jgi:hypothetical protein
VRADRRGLRQLRGHQCDGPCLVRYRWANTADRARADEGTGSEGPDERGLLRRPRWPSASAWPTCAGQDE